MAEYRSRRKRLGSLRAFQDTESLGAQIWEMLPWNYDQIRREYEAVGKIPPSESEVREMAIDRAITAAREQARNTVSAFGTGVDRAISTAQLALIAIIVAGAVYLMDGKRRRK